MKKRKKESFESFRTDEKSSYKTIKTTLKSVLRDNNIVPVLENLVLDINDLVIHTYQFIRLYILYHYANKLELPTIDETFIMYCIRILGTRDNRGAKNKKIELLEQLGQFYENEYHPLLNHTKTDLKNKTQMMSYISTQIFTSISNNVQEHFIQHLLRFINKTLLIEDKQELFKFKKQLLECSKEQIENEQFKEWYDLHISNILPKNINKSVHYDIKIDPLKYLGCLFYMNSVLEEKEFKLFQPLPLRTNIIPKNIIMDTACLVYLFCPEGQKKGVLLKDIKNNQFDIWNSFINLNDKIFRNKHYEFNYQIQTDGISCSLLFIKKGINKKWGSKVPTLKEQEFHNIEDLTLEQLEDLKLRNIVGCDPGKRNLVYMVDKNGKKLKYTCFQKKIESKAKRNMRVLLSEKNKTKIEGQSVIALETELSTENSKTVNYEFFKNYLVAKDKLNNELKEFYQISIWRKIKFREYSYSNKSIDNFLNKIKETFGSNILIGYGNWSRDTQMKFFMPTMNKGLRKLIHKKYDTITINEQYTSKKCCGCHKDLSHYKDSNGKEVFRLLKCSGCVSSDNKKIVFRTRDVNSGVNIMDIASSWIKNQTRPKSFCRPLQTPSSTDSINKEELEKVGPSLLILPGSDPSLQIFNVVKSKF